MCRSILALVVFGVGCAPDYDLGTVKETPSGGPAIEVSPTTLAFGMSEPGTALSEIFTITSIGDQVATVDEIRIDGSAAFTIVFPAARLAAGESTDVVVDFLSTGIEESAEAEIFSDDPASPHIVTLLGGTALPELTIEPADVDFGYVGVGASGDETVTLTNTGGATLTIDGISETDSHFTDGYAGGFPLVLAPGESTDVDVSFTPTGTDRESGRMEVVSDDPEGLKWATLEGIGAGDQPIAVCEASPPEVATLETMTWIGSGSYDPAGFAITDYTWTLVTRPAGSTATMPAGGANRSRFLADLAGTYEAELVVENELGEVSEPCTATLEAIPGEDLWIEIFWVHSGDDMDLHLTAPGGSLTSTLDCYYANCTSSGLDWGVRGDSSDNPALDLDDISGVGPENINIGEPEAGTFTVYVHDYPGSVYNGNNDVTMNIYVGGVLEWTDTRNVNSEDYYSPFAEIEWPSGTVTTL